MARHRDYTKIEQIFESTLKLVLEKGFAGLKMAEVAKEANLATGTVYIYFKDKDDLINQLYLFLKRRKTILFLQGIDQKEDFDLVLKKIWFAYFEVTMQHVNESAFLEQYYRSPFLKSNVKEESKQILKPIYDLLERGVKEGKLHSVNVEILLSQIVGPIHEMIRAYHDGAVEINAETMNQLYQLVMRGIKA
jgi:TetR/AcrR family transcriptional regulator, repressor of fatR-cypB operon